MRCSHRHHPAGTNGTSVSRTTSYKNIVLDFDSLNERGVVSDRELGQHYGLEWAEAFHYIGARQLQLEP